MHQPYDSFSNNPHWLTAKVTTPASARRFIRHLDVLGFDYQIVPYDHQLRILVRRDKLREVLTRFEELTPLSNSRDRRCLTGSRCQWTLLLAIPFGGFLGTVLATILGYSSPVCASVTAICVSIIALAIERGLRSPNSNRKGHSPSV